MPQPAMVHVQPFGRGPRVYVGGVPNCVTEEGVREHFRKWGSVSDVYFPGARGQKRLTYCFVTFDNLQSAERACNESERSLDGWVRCCCLHGASRQTLQAVELCNMPLNAANRDNAIDVAISAHCPLHIILVLHLLLKMISYASS